MLLSRFLFPAPIFELKMSRLLARGVVLSPLPDLQAADKKTMSHALHDDIFIGLEEDWTGFFDDVMSYFKSTPWHQHDKVISYRPGPKHSCKPSSRNMDPAEMRPPSRVASFRTLASI